VAFKNLFLWFPTFVFCFGFHFSYFLILEETDQLYLGWIKVYIVLGRMVGISRVVKVVG
jgi:amino acid permease